MKHRDEKLTGTAATVRPTRNRLLTAMGLSACVVALLIASFGLLLDLLVSVSRTDGERSEPLTVRIKKDEIEKEPDLAADNKERPTVPRAQDVPAERFEVQPETTPNGPPEPPAESQPPRDWRAMTNQVAKSTVNEHFRQEEAREALWRESRSVMFEPSNEMVLKSEAPVLADFQFRPQIHVLGVGMTIGSCFFGIPIAGVPVEQRNVAVTLFVCADGS